MNGEEIIVPYFIGWYALAMPTLLIADGKKGQAF
jgi:hypothetical protein